VFSELHGHDAGDGVGVVGGADHDSVNLVVYFIEHPAKVFVWLSLRVQLECPGGMRVVDIAESDDILLFDALYVSGTSPTNTDTGNVKL
jgi:hypothetical protein